MKSEHKSQIAALITVFLWASAFPAVRYLLDYYSPESVMVLRFLVASATIIVIIIGRKLRLPERRDLPLFAFAGFLGIFLYMWLFNVGVSTVPSGVSAFLIASSPVFAALFSIVFLKERVGPVAWTGIIVSFFGLIAVTASQMSGFEPNIGVVLLVGASIATSLYTIIQRQLMKKYTALEAGAYCMLFGTLFMLIFLPNLIKEMPGVPLEANLLAIYLGVFPAAIAYLAWSYALSKTSSTARVTVFLYLVPFIATLLAFLWLGEAIALLAFAGGVIIIIGMIIAGLQKKEDVPPAEELAAENTD
ncbi:MAG: DMT family transporter [Coriobacteriia bacterium]|nr:DMT family transporter [Coriobacteriia bacterium]